MYRILIAEDDAVIAGAIEEHIKAWGMAPRVVTDFSNVTGQFTEFAPQLVLMDISLPFYNGYYWCAEIRKISKVPVIFISSAADNLNIVMAVDMGADDFIAKPFDFQVLTAKIRAVLRRTYDFAGTAPLVECKNAIFNIEDATVRVGDNVVELTKNEQRIMSLLALNKGKTVSRETIMTKLWESDCYIDENTLNVNINRLRAKLCSAGGRDIIKTRKGIGYIIE